MKAWLLIVLLAFCSLFLLTGCHRDREQLDSGYYFKFKRNGVWENFPLNMGGGENTSQPAYLVIGATAADSSEYINFTFSKTGATGHTPDSTGAITPAYIPDGQWFIRLKNGSFITNEKLYSDFKDSRVEVTDSYIKGSISGTLTYIYPVGKKNTITEVEFYIERRF